MVSMTGPALPLAAERLRLHHSILAGSLGASAVLAVVVLTLLWTAADRMALLAWGAALMLALGVRLVVAIAHDRAPSPPEALGAWLRRVRLGFAAHGLVWAAAGLWLRWAGHAQADFLVLALTAITAGSLITTAFDIAAAACFALPVLASLLFGLLAGGEQDAGAQAMIVMLFMAITWVSALRTQRTVREAVQLRRAEADRANEARRHAERAEQARTQVEEQHRLLELLLHNTLQGFWFIDAEGISTDVNPAMCTLLGRPREQIVGRSVIEFFDGADLQQLRNQIEARQRGEAGGYEIGLTRPDGSRLHCYNNATPIYDQQGQRTGSIGIWTDITARRRSEMALRTYELVANSITDLVSVIDEDHYYRMVNDAWCAHTGLAREAVLGRRSWDVLPAVATEERRRASREAIESQQPRTVRGLADTPGLAGRHVETTYYPYTDDAIDMRCVVIVSRDVTEQEASREQLAASAEYLRRTLNATGDAIFASDALDPHEPVRFVNDQMMRMWGIADERAVALTPQEIMTHARALFADPAAETRRVERIIASNAADESQVHLRDGRVLLRRCVPAQAGGRAVRVWSFRDITAEQRALDALQNSEAELRALLEAFPGFITRVNADLVYTYANRRVADRLETTPEQIVGRRVGDVVGPERETWLRGHFERALAGEPVTYERFHGTGRAKGSTDQVTLAVGTDPRTGGASIYTFGIDITARKQAEEQLRAASEQLARKTRELQITLDSIDQGITSVDAAGRVGVFNRRMLELLDLPESLLTPQTTYDDVVRFQVARGDLAQDASFMDAHGRRQFFRGGRATAPEVYLRRTRSGAVVEVRTRQLAEGGLVRTFSDVTAYFESQQALLQSESRLRALLDAFPGYIAAIDQDDVYTYVNDRLAALFERAAGDIVGRRLRDILDESQSAAVASEIEAAKAGARVTSERSYPATPRRAQLDLEVTHVAGPEAGDGRRAIYVFGVDVTARKRAELASIAARDEAERANQAKSQFLSQMSHELRTPLNAILGFGQLLDTDPSMPLAEVQRLHVREIMRGGRHLLTLIDEILDLGRIEAGHLRLDCEAVVLRDLVIDCLNLTRPLTAARSVVLPTGDVPSPDIRVLADRTRLKQILLNLLSNAIKYNRVGGHVEITCRVDDDAVTLGVRDEGQGLTAPEMQRLFQPFERLGAARSGIEGTGIGLALSRRLVQAMGGAIGVDSQVGSGSHFWIRLPIAESKPVSDPTAPAALSSGAVPLHPGQVHRVLYIEDNPVNVLLMQAMLERLPGVQLLCTAQPQQGLAWARAEPTALVMVDIQLPGMDGYEVLRHLRARESTRHIPVIAVSANAMPDDIAAGLAAGFGAYLTKPIELARLLEVVRRFLAASSAAD